jgi:hypothetical protein
MKKLNLFEESRSHLYNYEDGDDSGNPEFAVMSVDISEHVVARLYSDDLYYMATYYDRDDDPFLMEMLIVAKSDWISELDRNEDNFKEYLESRETKEVKRKKEEAELKTDNSVYFNPHSIDNRKD